MSHAQGRLLHIPGRGDAVEGDVEFTLLRRTQRHGRGAENSTGFPQGDLVHLVGELNGEVEGDNRFRPGVHDGAAQNGDFLMKKILRAAQSDVFHMNVGEILNLCRIHFNFDGGFAGGLIRRG